MTQRRVMMARRVGTTWLESELAHLELFPSLLVRPPGTLNLRLSIASRAAGPQSTQSSREARGERDTGKGMPSWLTCLDIVCSVASLGLRSDTPAAK